MISSGRGGKIVLISSISGHRVNYPQPQIAYNVSKSAILHMRDSLAAEWTRYGIRVNSISPGYMDTVLNEGEDLAPWRAIWADRNPMRRMGSPQEMTGPVVFLCSDIGGSYVNGTDLVVDGRSFFPLDFHIAYSTLRRWTGLLNEGTIVKTPHVHYQTLMIEQTL